MRFTRSSARRRSDAPSTPETVLEWWPDHGHEHPLWLRAGARGRLADLDRLGLAEPLADRLRRWSGAFEEHRLPLDGDGDVAWLREGKDLLTEVRTARGGAYRVVVTEPWWGEEPTS